MSDKMRWRYGDTNPVTAAVEEATVIEIGDLLWQETDNAKPASMIPAGNEGDHPLLGMQNGFAEKFLGVAMQRSRSGDTTPIRVATTGVFEFDCVPRHAELGDMVGAGYTTDGRELLNQEVGHATESTHAIGRVAKQEPVQVGSVLVDIRSTVMTGGVLTQ